MRPWMEKRMNGKMRPAFTQRRLFARRGVGVGHRQERRSQGEAAGRGVPFFATGRGRRGSRASAGPAGLRADGSGPSGTRRSGSPSPATIPEAIPPRPPRLSRTGKASKGRRPGPLGRVKAGTVDNAAFVRKC